MSSKSKHLPRIGLVGVTGWGKVHFDGIRYLVDQGLAQWGAVTIINREQAAEAVAYFQANGVPVYPSYEAMLTAERKRLTWVSIPTGIGWHAPMTIAALEAGIPAFVEKPLTGTMAEAKRMLAAEATSGLHCAVGFQHFYRDTTRQICAMLAEGVIGKLQEINFLGLWPRSTAYYERNHWAGRIHDGRHTVLDSPFNNAFSHGVMLMLTFARAAEGPSTFTHLAAELYRAKGLENYDTIWTRLVSDQGLRLHALLSHSSVSKNIPEIHLRGESGTIIWRWFGDHSLIRAHTTETIPEMKEHKAREQLFRDVNAFFTGQDKVVCRLHEAARHTWWVNAVQDVTTITEIPPNHRFRFQRSDQAFDAIRDLEYWAHRSFAENQSPSALNAPWAQPGGQISLRTDNADLSLGSVPVHAS